jgi:hypothetical protein
LATCSFRVERAAAARAADFFRELRDVAAFRCAARFTVGFDRDPADRFCVERLARERPVVDRFAAGCLPPRPLDARLATFDSSRSLVAKNERRWAPLEKVILAQVEPYRPEPVSSGALLGV